MWKPAGMRRLGSHHLLPPGPPGGAPSPSPSPPPPDDPGRRWWDPRRLIPAGFHMPGPVFLKRLLYIGMAILTAIVSAFAGRKYYNYRYERNYRRNIHNDTHPWDHPLTQRSIHEYLGPDYKYEQSLTLFPRQDQYVIFPADYDKDPVAQRWIKRRDLDNLYQITYRQAKRDDPWADYKGGPALRHIRNYPDIPGVDNYNDLKALEGPAFSAWQRGQFRRGVYDRTSNTRPLPPPEPAPIPPPASYTPYDSSVVPYKRRKTSNVADAPPHTDFSSIPRFKEKTKFRKHYYLGYN